MQTKIELKVQLNYVSHEVSLCYSSNWCFLLDSV